MATFVTPKQLTERQPAINLNGLRAIIFNEEKNGLKESGAISRIGRKILINEEKFIAWIESGASA